MVVARMTSHSLWVGLVFSCVVGAVLGSSGLEVEVLLAIKSGLHDPSGALGHWVELGAASGEQEARWCSWRGIQCSSSSSSIVGLNLSSLNLSGTISDRILQLAGSLATLNISNNQFAGALPLSFTNLTQLQSLDISRNSFNGSLPRGFYRLKALVNFTAYSNSFSGPLPLEFAHIPSLQHFDLGGSYFSGPIPSEYGALSAVGYLDLSGNTLSGPIPPQLGSLPAIRLLKIGWNKFNGGIPPELGNASTLEYLDISGASLTGPIPHLLGRLSRLNTLFLYRNMLTGIIPSELGNISAMMSLDLSQNMLSGGLPQALASLHNLTLLNLMCNQLSGVIPTAISDLPHLTTFLIWNNSFDGVLPPNLGLASPLRWLDASENHLTGPIPSNLCAGGKLFKLMLFSNSFTGAIPRSLANCPELWRLRLEDNHLTGMIPTGFGSLKNFTYLDVSRNRISGPLPGDLMAAPFLQFMDISSNPISSSLPPAIWTMKTLQTFYAASADISGELSEVNECPPLIALDLSGNHLVGNISSGLALCEKLVLLNLTGNALSGLIPTELASLPVLSTLDLSHNSLSGGIPLNFQNATALEVLDVSYNDLTGSLPSGGLFKIINPSMFVGNKGLCGGVLGSCSSFEGDETGGLYPPPSNRRHLGPLGWIAGVIFAMTLVVFLAASRCFYKQYRWYICSKLRPQGDESAWKLTAFQRLSFTADDIVQCLTTNNIIGMGAAGTVYRADVPSGEVIAVKKLWRSQKDDAVDIKEQPNILGEVDVLGSVRHRNIVKLLGCCSSNEAALLLYEYMPNGSLGDLLHGNKEANVLADWMTRYKIAMGVAQGLCYLHHDCFPVVVHRDVKSNNILLDSNMEARVADFGVAKLIEAPESMSVIAGSYGYIAPEYAYTMQVDEKSDIYSFGVVLLELLTGKRPTEPEFGEAANIVEWVREKVERRRRAQERVRKSEERECKQQEDEKEEDDGKGDEDEMGLEAAAAAAAEGVLDAGMVGEGGHAEDALKWVREEMVLVLRVALLCTSKFPVDRPSMRDVVTMLSEAKPRRKSIPRHP